MIKATFALMPLVALTLCAGDETVSGYANPDAIYHLIEINGAAPAAPSTISFPAEGRVAGRAPCNTYTATQTQPYPWFNVEAIRSTRRACPDLSAEQQFFGTLQTMTLAEVSDAVLILSNEDGAQLVFEAR